MFLLRLLFTSSLFLLILKNLRRSKVRSILTVLAVVFLVAIVSMIWTVLRFLNAAMAKKESDIAVVITERYRIPSRFDRRFMNDIIQPSSPLNRELEQLPGFDSHLHNVWHFAVFSLDPEMKDPDKTFFCIATIPEKIPLMIDGLQDLDPQLTRLMQEPPVSRLERIGILMGANRLAKIGKKVGDVFKAKSLSHRDGTPMRKPILMDFEIVGEVGAHTRWTEAAFMDYEYLDRVLTLEKSELDGKVNLGWLKFGDEPSANAAGGAIEREIAELKSETGATAVSRFLEPYKDLLNGVRYLLVPAILAVMMVIVANAIGITVRERTKEMAVLKVLGFRPWHILALVLGEAILLGLVGGLLGSAVTYALINHLIGGIKIPIAFFPVFFVPVVALWWGPAVGAATAFLGAFVPAWSARRIKVSEVFAKVA